MQRNRGRPILDPCFPFFSRRSNDRLACPRLAPLDFERGRHLYTFLSAFPPVPGSGIDAWSSEFFLEEHGGRTVELRRNGKEIAASSRELKEKKRTLSRVLKIKEE